MSLRARQLYKLFQKVYGEEHDGAFQVYCEIVLRVRSSRSTKKGKLTEQYGQHGQHLGWENSEAEQGGVEGDSRRRDTFFLKS